jgi:glycosyltransferase involved in cell wall biosynthesis
MRLAVEVTTCTASRTGIGYYTEHLVDGLLETRAPDDELVLIANRPPAPELAARWAPHLRLGGGPVRAAWMQVDAPAMLAEAGADVAAFPNYVVPLASPCPTMVFVHDLALLRVPQFFTLRKRLVIGPLLRQSIAASSVVATVSEASRQDIVDCLGVDPGRIALLPAAPHPSCKAVSAEVVAAARARHGLPRPYVLTVGTLEPRKNLLTLLEAFDRLALPGRSLEMDLVIVGGRGWRDRRLVQALGERRSGRVRWLGYVPEEDLVALYGGAALFVYPSRLEGFGLPVVEAMACGTPVVASDVPALREVAGEAARFVPPADAGALATAITEMLADRGAVARARIDGPARAAAFSWTRTAERMWALARETGPARARVSAKASPPADEAPALPPPLAPTPRDLPARAWTLAATVAYADLFDCPLPVEDATRAVIGAALDEAEVRRLLRDAHLAEHVQVHPGGYLTLAGREALVARRREGEAQTRVLLEQHRRILAGLATLPFVRMLALSGGAVHANPGPKADIDLFAVAAAGRAYTAYTFLVLATKLTRTRAIVCPNYLVDERELGIAYHHDVFTAHQVVSARPLSGEATYAAFCRANQEWVRELFPGFQPREPLAALGGVQLQRVVEGALWAVAPALERLLRWGWRAHLRRRAARAPRADVVLGDGILKLHLSDYRRRVLERFAAKLAALRTRIEDAAPRSAAAGARAARP